MILRIQGRVLTINMHSIAWHISAHSHNVSEKGGGKPTLEKSFEEQGSRGGEIHHPKVQQVLKLDLELKSIKIEHQLMRISTGWRGWPRSSVCQLQLILFSFKMWINTTGKKYPSYFESDCLAVLWSQVGSINDIISPGSTKQFVRGRRGEGRRGKIF